MILKQWLVADYPFPNEGKHPCVIISRDEICADANRQNVNVLFCTSWRLGGLSRKIRDREVLLDEADGLDWQTFVRCDFIDAAYKNSLRALNGGMITLARRRAITAKINELFRFKF